MICPPPWVCGGQSILPHMRHIVLVNYGVEGEEEEHWSSKWNGKKSGGGTIGIARGRSSTRNPATWLWIWLWLWMSLVLVSHCPSLVDVSVHLCINPRVSPYIVAFSLVRPFPAIILPPPASSLPCEVIGLDLYPPSNLPIPQSSIEPTEYLPSHIPSTVMDLASLLHGTAPAPRLYTETYGKRSLQAPLSPPVEDQPKCSLPSISTLLEGADGAQHSASEYFLNDYSPLVL